MTNLQNTDDTVVIDVQNVKKKFRSYQDRLLHLRSVLLIPLAENMRMLWS